MKARTSLFVTAVVALALVTNSNADSMRAERVHSEFPSDPRIFSLFVALFTLGGLAGDERERAAFIVRTSGGAFEMLWWKECDRSGRAEYRGSIPKNAVAVVHTHPFHFPKGSPLDASEARRINLPFYVLTLASIYLVEPAHGRNIEIHRGRWIDGKGPASLSSRTRSGGSQRPQTLLASSR